MSLYTCTELETAKAIGSKRAAYYQARHFLRKGRAEFARSMHNAIVNNPPAVERLRANGAASTKLALCICHVWALPDTILF